MTRLLSLLLFLSLLVPLYGTTAKEKSVPAQTPSATEAAADQVADPLWDLAVEEEQEALENPQEDTSFTDKFNWDTTFQTVKDLSKGFLVSIQIFFLTLLYSLPLGLLIAFGRMSEITPVSWIFRLYISVMRGTPLMLQLLVWYFAPYYLFGLNLGKLSFCGIEFRFTAVIIGFALNYAAYFAEIYRAGIEAIPRGQYEAASVLGYTKCQTFVRIVLPQVIKRIIPPMTNETITLVKDTSLAFSLSVLEMFTVAKEIASAQTTMLPFIVAGVFYYVFNFIVAFSMEQLEKKLNYYR